MIDGDAAFEPALPPQVVADLGERLRGYYSHLMSEPVPDRFIQLLEKMDRGEKAGHGG
ncbi:NepR family anti-sigma factor [Microvirga roseola]|uniref:NepR family anti-sigma factor n=1 Tax=Microvirga roseola TaxID=2883126 RepID=UPI001E43F2FE|nr:NepR family anti-sigma factor [Microvirga roseola]